MPEGFEIIRARIKDDVAILIDRLMRSKHLEVVFVLPKNSIIAASPDSLKLLQHEAESVGKIFSLSTENSELKSFAQKLKIPIYDLKFAFPQSTSVKKIDKLRGIKRMVDILPPQKNLPEETHSIEEDSVPEPEFKPESPINFLPFETSIYQVSQKSDLEVTDNMELEKNLENFYNNPQNQSGGSKKNVLKWIIIFLVIIGSVSFLTTIYLSLPQANIEVSIKKIPLKASIPVAISKNINSSNLTSGIIPGQYFLLTKSGSKVIEEKQEELPLKAGGFIDIYNAYSALPQKLVAQTRFETKDGKIFRIQKSIIVPGAKKSGNKLIPSSIRMEVLADSFGEKYNLEPSYFTIPGFKGTPKYAGFYAKSTESMIGKKVVAPLTKENLEKYKKELQVELTEELKNDTLVTVKDSDLKLINGASSIKVDDVKVNNQIITMKITWQAIFFRESDIKTLINHFISNQNPDLKNFSFEDNIEYPKVSRVDFPKGELFFVLEINKENTITTNTDSLKKELAGLDESQMRTLISSKNFINSAVISLWPFWVKQAPNNPMRINIKLNQFH